MPDHLHALACATACDALFPRFVRIAKQRSGFEFKRVHGERLWQRSCFDRTLREDDSEIEVIKYILNNPIQRQLAESAVDYPFWSSQIHSREEILEHIAAHVWPPAV